MNPWDGGGRRESRGSAHTWHWYAARGAVALIVLAVIGLLRVLRQQELEERRSALIRDVLWIEQSIRFGLDRDVDHLRELALGLHAARPDLRQFEVHSAVLLSSSPGLLQVVVLDRAGRPVAMAPTSTPALTGDRPWVDQPDGDAAYRLALATGKPAYAAPRRSGGEHQFEVFIPYAEDGVPGVVVGVYGLRALLSDVIPWWLAEKHRITLRDPSGSVLAASSTLERPAHPDLAQQALLDPPGHGLLLHLESYEVEARPLRDVLAITIVSLAATILWTVWSLRRHVQRRVHTEQALREEHAFRKAMEDSLETGMRAVDLDGRIVYVNPAFCRMVGWSEAELIGSAPPQPFWPAEERDRIEAVLAAARGSGDSHVGIELTLVRRGGERFDALLYEAPLVDAEGRRTGWMGSVLDITHRKRARERLRQQEERLASTARLVTMGEMASAIAHELNQPLSAIASYCTGSLNMLAAGAARPDDLREALEKTAEQARRAGRIIRRVHDFARKSEPTRTRTGANAVVQEAMVFARAEAAKRGFRVVARLADEELALDCDPLLVQQVVLNLVRNGMDAVDAAPDAPREVEVATRRDGAQAVVSVTDRGCGLSREVKEQLFVPFFSTKAEGMGMGLNICRSVVEAHGGRLWARAGADGVGAVFSFALPAAPPDRADAAERRTRSAEGVAS